MLGIEIYSLCVDRRITETSVMHNGGTLPRRAGKGIAPAAETLPPEISRCPSSAAVRVMLLNDWIAYHPGASSRQWLQRKSRRPKSAEVQGAQPTNTEGSSQSRRTTRAVRE